MPSSTPSQSSATRDADQPRVVGCTCFRVRRLARRVTQIYDRVLAPSGLRVTQFSLLSRLATGGPVAISPLAAALDMERTTLTRNLKPLVDAGFVTLTTCEEDARQRKVRLTRLGHARYRQAHKLRRQAQDELNRALGPAQVASLHAMLDVLVASLDGTEATARPS